MKAFLIATFGLTWLVWIPIAILQPGQQDWLVPLVLLGAFMPSIMGVLFGGILSETERRRDFWRRIFDLKRIKPRYWLFMLLLAPLMNSVGWLSSYLAGGPPLTLDPAVFGSVSGLFIYLVFILISGPLAEELGWRGLLLPELLDRHHALKATLIVGAIWVIWHLPLFWIEGTTQYAQGLVSVHGVQWIIEVMCLSVIVSWLFVNTASSTFAAVFIHFMDNLSFSTFAGPDYERDPVAAAVVTCLYVVITAVLMIKVDHRSFKPHARH